jgi:hypothetical protein
LLHYKAGHGPVRVLWEEEVLPVLAETHEGGSHYPKDPSKFRVLVEERFWFPQITEVTKEYIESCPNCLKERAGHAGRTDREIYPAPPVDPFFRVHVDLMGPLEPSKPNGYTYIMLVIDPVTKFLSGRPIKDKKASTVAQAFQQEILDRHSFPFQVVTDRGSEFNGKFKRQLVSRGAKHVNIRTRNPKANGQVERLMPVLKGQLRVVCDKNPTSWEKHVARVIFDYNVTYQESIKTSPFIALYGRKPILPADHMFEPLNQPSLETNVEASPNQLVDRIQNLQHIQSQVKVTIEDAQTKAKENYARWNSKKRKRIDNLSKGDLVIMQKPGTIKGFRLHYEGPYTFKGWTGEGEKRLAVLQDNNNQLWTRRGVEVVKFKPREQIEHDFLRLRAAAKVSSQPTHLLDLNQPPALEADVPLLALPADTPAHEPTAVSELNPDQPADQHLPASQSTNPPDRLQGESDLHKPFEIVYLDGLEDPNSVSDRHSTLHSIRRVTRSSRLRRSAA